MKMTMITTLAIALLFGAAAVTYAQTLEPIQLPAPQKTGGMSLMEALANRHSDRAFSPRALEPQVLSNLLWAAFGVNREDGRRTAPSAVNWQEVTIYITLPGGAYRYNPQENRLDPVAADDLRAATGQQPFPATAPLNLVYVADYSRMGDAGIESEVYAGMDTGFIAQNVYLYCASAGLSTVVRAMVDREALGKALHLSATQHVTLCQTVGYPPE